MIRTLNFAFVVMTGLVCLGLYRIAEEARVAAAIDHEVEERVSAAIEATVRGAVEAVPDQRWNHLLTEIVKANTWEHYDEHMGWRPGAA